MLFQQLRSGGGAQRYRARVGFCRIAVSAFELRESAQHQSERVVRREVQCGFGVVEGGRSFGRDRRGQGADHERGRGAAEHGGEQAARGRLLLARGRVR
jgi:hypothetical protein